MSGLGMSIYSKGEISGIQQGMQQGMQQGRQQGRQEAMNEMSRVIQVLIAAGRINEIDRITRDTDYYNQVKKELSV